MDPKTSLPRDQVPEEFTWNLGDIFESDEAWLKEYEALKALPERVLAFRGRLGESAESLLAFFRLQDEMEVRLENLYCYASCKNDQDTANGVYQDLRGKAMSTVVAVSSAAAFAAPEIMAIDDDRLNLFYIAQPELETYRRPLYEIRRRKAHILSPAEEKLLAAAGEMAQGPDNISGILRDADLQFPDAVDKDGVSHALTDGSFIPLMESSDRVLRRSAFEQYY